MEHSDSTKQQTTFSYTQSIAIGLCERVDDFAPAADGAIAGILRIWENGQIVYDIRVQQSANSLTNTAGETDVDYQNRLVASAAYAETFTLHLGTDDQDVDPTIEAIEGVGMASAYRGLAYIVYTDRALAASQGLRHPNFTFECFTDGSIDCEDTVEYSTDRFYHWADLSAADPRNGSNEHSYVLVAGHSHTDLPSALDDEVNLNHSGFPLIPTILGHGNAAQPFPIIPPRAPFPDYADPKSVFLHFNSRDLTSAIKSAAIQADDEAICTFIANIRSDGFWWTGEQSNPEGGIGSGFWYISGNTTEPQADTGGNCGGDLFYHATLDRIVEVKRTLAPPFPPCFDRTPSISHPGYCIGVTGLLTKDVDWVKISSGNWHALQAYAEKGGGTEVDKYPLNPILPDTDPLWNDETFWTNAYNEAVAANLLPPGLVFNVDYPASQDHGYVLNGQTCTGVGSTTSIGAIVRLLSRRAGLSDAQTDTIDIDDVNIAGYTLSTICTAADGIAPLRSVGFFDCIESGDALRWRTRGKEIVRTLLTADIGCYDGDGSGQSVPAAVQISRADETTLPRSIRFHYKSVQRDYQDGQQQSQFRLTTLAVDDQDISVPICLDDTQALRASDIIWSDAWDAQISYKISIDTANIDIEVGDAIGVEVERAIQRMRITSDSVASGILRELTAVRDSDGSYVSFAVAQLPTFKPGKIIVIANTTYELLDIPALGEDANDPGFYIAAQEDPTGGNKWNGASFFKSVDGTTFDPLFSVTDDTAFGPISALLPAADPHFWDDANTVEVTTPTVHLEFESMTDAQVFAGGNRAALGSDSRWEIIQFGTATRISDTVWHLSHLLRGRRGTEHVIGTSFPGDLLVMLDGLGRVVLESAEIGATRTYRGVSIGAAAIAGVDKTFAGHAEALKPYSPTHITLTPDSGDILIAWLRRDRFGKALGGPLPTPMSEATEAYEVDILAPDLSVKRTLTCGILKTVTYTAAMQSADFPFGIGNLRVRVYQMSAIVGRGYPGQNDLEITASDVTSDGVPVHTSSAVVTFGGSFDATNDATVSVNYIPHSGAPSAYSFLLDGSTKSAVVDYATDLTSQAGTALAGKATVSRSGNVVTIASTSGAIDSHFTTNAPIAQTDVIRPAIGIQAAVSQQSGVDLYTNLGVLSPSTDTAFQHGGTGSIYYQLSSTDPEDAVALYQSINPPGSGYRIDDWDQSRLSASNAGWSIAGGPLINTYPPHLAGIPAALTGDAHLSTALQAATANTSAGAMLRAAVVVTMKPGYTFTVNIAASGTQPSGYKMGSQQVQTPQKGYAAGAAKIVRVKFFDQFDGSTGVYASRLEVGQVYEITVNGTTYSHTVDSSDILIEDPDLPGDLFRNTIYDDLVDQINTATGGTFTITKTKYKTSDPTIDQYVQISIHHNTPNTDFTCSADVPFDLTVSLVVTP